MGAAGRFWERLRGGGAGSAERRGRGGQRIALFVDADNQSHRDLGELVARAEEEGNVSIRRAYADWADPRLHRWREECERHAVRQIHATAYSVGKNATDLFITIDIMECCLTDQADEVWLISGDSDFTPLVGKLREHGIRVVGAGGGGVSSAFQRACDEFILLGSRSRARAARAPMPVQNESDDSRPWEQVVSRALPARTSTSEDDGWAHLGSLGNELRRQEPPFDYSDYGFSAMRKMIESRPDLFEIEARPTRDPKSPSLYARLKSVPRPAGRSRHRRRRLPRPERG